MKICQYRGLTAIATKHWDIANNYRWILEIYDEEDRLLTKTAYPSDDAKQMRRDAKILVRQTSSEVLYPRP